MPLNLSNVQRPPDSYVFIKGQQCERFEDREQALESAENGGRVYHITHHLHIGADREFLPKAHRIK